MFKTDCFFQYVKVENCPFAYNVKSRYFIARHVDCIESAPVTLLNNVPIVVKDTMKDYANNFDYVKTVGKLYVQKKHLYTRHVFIFNHYSPNMWAKTHTRCYPMIVFENFNADTSPLYGVLFHVPSFGHKRGKALPLDTMSPMHLALVRATAYSVQ